MTAEPSPWFLLGELSGSEGDTAEALDDIEVPVVAEHGKAVLARQRRDPRIVRWYGNSQPL